jgi:hypothetical protein
MVNEITRFGGLNCFFLMILSEQIILCIIKFGMFVKILEDH